MNAGRGAESPRPGEGENRREGSTHGQGQPLEMSTISDEACTPREVAVRFLQKLWPVGPWNLVAIEPDGKPLPGYCTTENQVRAYVEQNDGLRNVYYSVNPLRG